ncbi:hypothetical protein S245_066102, partial [Arachis hypogaea]
VNDEMNCAFLKYIGYPCSPHNNVIGACLDLLNQKSHIQNIIEDHTCEEIQKNRLRLKSSIDTTQAMMRLQNKKIEVIFFEMIKLIASYNDKVTKIVLENVSYDAKYTSHQIQKKSCIFSQI